MYLYGFEFWRCFKWHTVYITAIQYQSNPKWFPIVCFSPKSIANNSNWNGNMFVTENCLMQTQQTWMHFRSLFNQCIQDVNCCPILKYCCFNEITKTQGHNNTDNTSELECGPMPSDGHPAKYRWCPLAQRCKVWLTPTTRVPCSNAANMVIEFCTR